MIKDAPAFDFYPERWLAGVAVLSDAEQLSFLRLLCHQWLKQGLPADVAKLQRLAGKGVTDDLLFKFPLGEDGLRRNERLETIRDDQRARIAKKSEQRKAAAHARWDKPQCGGNAVASVSHNLPQCGSDAHHPPPTTHPITAKAVNKETPAALSPLAVLPFDSPAFAEAWSKWKRHRSEIRKPLKPTMEAEQLAELAAMGELRAVACLLHTIAKGWQGLREPENATNRARPRNAAYDAHTATLGLTPDQIGKF